MKKWKVERFYEVVGVVPEEDLSPHEEDRASCACGPRVEHVGRMLVVVHNSYDGREVLEAAIKEAFDAASRN